ncbi:MAG: hypothetical protein EVA30_04245 [Candidatus Dadabacteria bacterium]|nr:MAG: hypothetical protein EVA30_04245 [Candidatus Dadabacteria bacterium]
MGRKHKINSLFQKFKEILLTFFFLFFIIIIPTHSHDDHGKMIEASNPYPDISVDITKDASSNYELDFKLKNFKLIAEGQSIRTDINSGHIFLFINNKKEIMIDKVDFLLNKDLLKKGKNELFIMLMDQSHYLYTKGGRIIYVSKRIYIK